MKKLLRLSVFLFVITLPFSLIAQENGKIRIKSFEGKVQIQENGIWKDVDKKSVLTEESIIRTGPKSSIIFVTEKGEKTVFQMKKGTVGELLSKEDSSNQKSKPIFNKNKIKSGTQSQKSHVSVAGTRADDQSDEDFDWEE